VWLTFIVYAAAALCIGFLAHLLAHDLLLSDTFDSTARLTWCLGSRQIAKGRVLYRRL
jgi:hypothetical protein